MRKRLQSSYSSSSFGTRFLPQTKAMPKEMLPVIDKPIIQYVVEELVDAGVEEYYYCNWLPQKNYRRPL